MKRTMILVCAALVMAAAANAYDATNVPAVECHARGFKGQGA